MKPNRITSAGTKADSSITDDITSVRQTIAKPNVVRRCSMCNGKGWYFVNEWFGNIQGRKDCNCKTKKK